MPKLRPTLLIVGCGDIGLRVLREISSGWRVLALTSQPARRAELRAAGALPLVGDLDQPRTLGRLARLADAVLHLAPPPSAGRLDTRSRHLLQALARGARVRRLVYASTTGVYGDAGGARVDETWPPHPATARAHRRADAEAQWRWAGRRLGIAVTILRVPGIYAADRAGGDPRDRVRRAAPVLVADDDVFTNHIHADDLARACIAALHRGAPQRIVNVCDDSELKMGDYFDLVAELHGLPRPPRLARDEARRQLSPMTLSFMGESRRLANARMKRELRLRLRYPTVREGLPPG
ncbi:MAG: SDR family oxidoreductase [Burkholderiales bacterium]|nr:SDR family oxidoreductase [Burkholderiales bacterium]